MNPFEKSKGEYSPGLAADDMCLALYLLLERGNR